LQLESKEAEPIVAVAEAAAIDFAPSIRDLKKNLNSYV